LPLRQKVAAVGQQQQQPQWQQRQRSTDRVYR